MSEESIKTFRTYKTPLGEKLFPGNDFFSMQNQTLFSEVLTAHNKERLDIEEFIEFMNSFSPAMVQDAIDDPSWTTEGVVSRWEFSKLQIAELLRNSDIEKELTCIAEEKERMSKGRLK